MMRDCDDGKEREYRQTISRGIICSYIDNCGYRCLATSPMDVYAMAHQRSITLTLHCRGRAA